MKMQISVSEGSRAKTGDVQYRLNMSWKLAFLYVQEGGSHTTMNISVNEALMLAGNAFGYTVRINNEDEKACIRLIYEGIETHIFSNSLMLKAAYEFLLSCLAFNARYHPYEETSWSLDSLEALCYLGEKLKHIDAE